MNKKTLLVCIVLLIATVGAGSFFGGVEYTKNKSPFSNLPQDAQQRFQRMGANINTGQAGIRNIGNSLINGEILAVDNQSITVKNRDGGSKIIFFSTSTQITKSTDGSINDLQIGQNIMANGTTNQDGSITAQSIQLRPAIPVP
ncbi:MAG: DUF5666 domain-containing protein [Candidatus Pacebacteria bacterium]|nr:DUF5666 domain-containing protein [Candidatus Paceibacterota bacterium]